jgi:syntaxin 1B/2/3
MKLKYSTDTGCTISDSELTLIAQEFVDLEQESPRLTTAKQTLGEIMGTRTDYLKMARSMKELQQLYQDLAALVLEQSASMDRINENFVAATTSVETGRNETNEARGYAKKNSKCMLWAVVLIAIILCFVLAVVVGFTV